MITLWKPDGVTDSEGQARTPGRSGNQSQLRSVFNRDKSAVQPGGAQTACKHTIRGHTTLEQEWM